MVDSIRVFSVCNGLSKTVAAKKAFAFSLVTVSSCPLPSAKHLSYVYTGCVPACIILQIG